MPPTLEQRRAGGRARARQFTAETQQAARAAVRPESLAASGRAGNAASVRKYGQAVHARRLAHWRKYRLTNLTRAVAGWLDAAFVIYDTEVELVPGKAYADIVPLLGGHQLDIECDGAHWHEMPGRAEQCAARDALVRAAGYTVIRLAEADIESGAAKEVLSQELGIEL